MKKAIIYFSLFFFVLSFMSCKKYLDINKDPDALLESQAPIAQVLTSATTTIGFTGGSDLFRYAALLTQQFSGQTTAAETQTQSYEKYLIQATDLNNLFNLIYATTLNDLEVIIRKGTELKAPHYTGVAKLLKAYTYQISVDAFGDLPYSETQQTTANLFPKYDDDVQIYKELIKLIDEGIKEINEPVSTLSPGTNSTIYSGTFATRKANWIKFGNTLKLRIFLHYSKLDKAFTVSQITSLVNSTGISFMQANADNFEMPFLNEANRQNPINQFELARGNYLFPNVFLVNRMNAKSDPRRPFFFTQFPAGSGNYVGAKAADVQSQRYSRMHVYLRGAATNIPTANADGSYDAAGSKSITYTGDAPIRMLTYAEYNFIRAEAALYGAPGNVETFFQEGIRANMQNAGVAAADIAVYITANGTLTGSNENKLMQIIDEKYIALYGVIMEPWTDWRRTGYPQISPASNTVLPGGIPRSLLIPQNEIDLNKNAPKQKANMLERVFWDK